MSNVNLLLSNDAGDIGNTSTFILDNNPDSAGIKLVANLIFALPTNIENALWQKHEVF